MIPFIAGAVVGAALVWMFTDSDESIQVDNTSKGVEFVRKLKTEL